MYLRKAIVVLLPAAILLASCGSSKEELMEKGNKLFAAGNFKEAAINYRKAIRKDARLGEAHYKLGLAELKAQKPQDAFRALMKAQELMPQNVDAKVQFAELCLQAYSADPKRPKFLYDQLTKVTGSLVAQEPSSFQSIRLQGYIAMVDGKTEDAIRIFRQADTLKPQQPDVVISLAQNLFKAKRESDAEQALKGLLAIKKDTLGAYDLLYLYYSTTKRESQAEQVLQEKRANNPKDPGAALQVAAHFGRAQRTDEMKKALQPLLDNTKDFPTGRLLVGDFYARIRNLDEALRLYREGEKMDGKEKNGYQRRQVETLLAMSKKEEAGKILETILKEKPDDKYAQSLRAGLRLDSGSSDNVQQGIADFEAMVKKTPSDANLHFTLARAYLVANNRDAARVQLTEAARLKRDHLPARVLLGQLEIDSGKPAEALRPLNEALALDPKNAMARVLHAAAQTGTGKIDEAKAEVEGVLKDYPAFPDAHLQMGVIQLSQKQFKDAEATFQKFYKPGEKEVRPLRGLVETYAAQNQFDKAAQLLKSDMEKSRAPEQVRNLLAAIYLRAGKVDEAAAEYQTLTQKNPNDSGSFFMLAQIYQRKGDYANAIASFQKVQQLTPKDVRAGVLMGSVMEQAGRREDAKSAYRKVLETDPENAVAQNNLAYVLAETGGDLSEALTLATKALQRAPEQPNFADTLGWVYLKRNQPDSAAQVFNKLVRSYPKDPTFRYHHGLALLKKGDKQNARSELQAALANGATPADQTQIKQALGQLN